MCYSRLPVDLVLRDDGNTMISIYAPMTTRLTLYIMHAPVHMSHGDRVVYIVAPLYAEAGNLPAFSSAEISA